VTNEEPVHNDSKILARYGSCSEQRLGRLIKVVPFKTTNTTSPASVVVVVVVVVMVVVVLLVMWW
jgi:hypothetical protein